MVRTEKAQSAGTAAAILDIAEGLVQRRGFNGFSYADIAAEMGITKASLHYHFRGKAELGENLVTRYTVRFVESLGAIDQTRAGPVKKLEAYCDIYRTVLLENRLCLCGMLAAEYETLPELMRVAVRRFFDQNEQWLSQFLEQGRASNDLRFVGTSVDTARGIIASLEGGMLVSRPYGNACVLDAVIERVIAEFSP
jgi:TetR/AcrR family transcriptional regulator, transcriptional repressor for nem operon